MAIAEIDISAMVVVRDRSGWQTAAMTDNDQVLDALEQLLTTLEQVDRSIGTIHDRAEHLLQLRAEGEDYLAIIDQEQRPLIVEVLTDMISELHEASSGFRRAEARALHREGVTMDRIGQLFGVTRQRISALLRN